MARFNWNIEDASDVEVSVCEGGEVELNDVKVVKGSGWAVEESDETVAITPTKGGVIEGISASSATNGDPEKVQTISSLNLGKKFNQTVIIIIIILFGLGFLAVVGQNVWHGKLDFQTYMVGVISFLAGLGLGRRP